MINDNIAALITEGEPGFNRFMCTCGHRRPRPHINMCTIRELPTFITAAGCHFSNCPVVSKHITKEPIFTRTLKAISARNSV